MHDDDSPTGREDAKRGSRTSSLPTRQLWVINVGLFAVVCSGYLNHAPLAQSTRMALFLYLGLLSCAATLSLVPGLLVWLGTRLPLRDASVAYLAAAVWTVGALLAFLDTQIYGIFRYHFNGMVWNVLTTPGADEAVHISLGEKSLVLGGALVLFAAELATIRFLQRRNARRSRSSERMRWFDRPGAIWRWGLIPSMLVVMGLYAHADLMRDRQVLALARLYPIYPRVTIKRFAKNYFGFELADRPKVDFVSEGILLDYPREPVELPRDGPTPNILILVVDSLRADMLDPLTMPRVSDFAQRAHIFEDHLSGGNGTRFGIFSLVYGLHGSYWRTFYQEQRSPVLVDALLDRGYETTVMTSASMSYPEFRSTAWVRIESTIRERLRAEDPNARDDGVEREFQAWLRGREDPDRPFFGFLLLDAPHGKYAFPEEFAHFHPFAENVEYLKLARGPNADELEQVYNRYRNSVLYADDVVGRILDGLVETGELEETIVLITGDHGDEFMENGFMGHTSNFTDAQLAVPLVYFDPELEPGRVTAPTSHIDVPATLLERLGANPELRTEWTLGGNLFEPMPERNRVASGWSSLGIRVGDSILAVPMTVFGGGSIEVYDSSWQVRADGDAFLAEQGAVFANLSRECRRFLR